MEHAINLNERKRTILRKNDDKDAMLDEESFYVNT